MRGARESEQWRSNGAESRVESESWSKYGVNVIITNNRVGVVRNVGNVRNASEEVRSKVRDMTDIVNGTYNQLPPWREVNHEIHLIDEDKQYRYLHCAVPILCMMSFTQR